MKQTKQIISAVLVLAMLAGCIVAFSLTSGAVNGVDLPAEAEGKVYNGTPSTSLKGAGTEADPYLIQSAADLMYLLNWCEYGVSTEDSSIDKNNILLPSLAKTEGKYYKLTADLYLNEKDAAKLNTLTTPTKTRSIKNTTTKKYETWYDFTRSFGGVLDGDGHTIYNLYAKGNYHWAMFDEITGTVKDLTIAGAYMYTGGTSSANGNSAVLANKLSGATVTNVHVTDAYLAGGSNGSYMGGFASFLGSGTTISHCTVSGTMTYVNVGTKTMNVGGFIGNATASVSGSDSVFSDCVSYMNIVAAGKNTSAGGFVGSTTGTEKMVFLRCENRGSVSVVDSTEDAKGNVTLSSDSRVGGFIGINQVASLTMQDCRNLADLTGYSRVGGLLGYVLATNYTLNPVLISCENRGNITVTTTYAGGLIAHVQDTRGGSATINDCANYGNVSADSYAGGFVGGAGNGNGGWASPKYTFVNSATYGNVCATAENAGLAFGSHVQQNAMKAVELNNCVLTGSVTAANNAGAIYGSMTAVASKYTAQSLSVQNSYVKADVKVAADGVAATLIGGSTDTYIKTFTLVTTDSQFDVTVTAGDVVQATPVSYYLVGEAKTVELPAMGATALTDRSAVTALSTYAEANGYSYWQQGQTAPELAVFYDGEVNITNGSALSHPYTGEVLNVTYDKKETVATVDVKWYSASDLTTPLTAIPTDAGTYRVVLTAYDAENNVLGGGNTFYQNFTIAKAATEITLDLSGYTDDGDGTYSIQYDPAGAQIPASTVNVTTGAAFTGAIVTEVTQDEAPATALMPGTYLFTFTYAGDGNHEAASTTLTLDIVKKQLTYPENVWKNQSGETVSEGYAPVYTGSEMSVALDADPSIFDITPAGTYTATNAAAGMTATATVALKADLTDRYEISGEAPAYTLTWSIERAPVHFLVVDGEGNAADLTNLIYQTSSRTFYVIVADAAGNQVATPADNTIVVTNAGTYAKTFSYAGSENYLPIAATEYSFTVSPVKLSASHAPIVKIYDGSAVIFTPDFGTAPKGTAWETAVAYVILKWNAETSAYDISVTEAVNGGKYLASFSCKTTNGNYVSEGSVEFTITQKAPTFTPNTEGWETVTGGYAVTYDGNGHAFLVTSDSDGAITVTYSTDGETYVATAPKNAAVYTVKVVVAATENYTEKTETYQVTVRKFVITVPEDANLWNYTGAFTYDGETHTVALSQEFLETYGRYLEYPYSGNYSETNANAGDATYRATVTLKLKDPANYEFAGGSTADVTKNLDWKIGKNTTTITVSDKTVTYNGETQSITGSAAGQEGTDFSAALVYTVTKDGVAVQPGDVKNAGVYTLTFTLDNDNLIADPVSVTLTVERARYDWKDDSVTVVGDTTFVSDGKTHTVTLQVNLTGADGAVTVDESRLPTIPTEPGIYTLTYYFIGTDNYEALDPYTVTLTVLKPSIPDADHGVEVVFPDGAAADLAVNVTEKETDKALKNALKDADTVKHAAIETLYTYSFVNGEGKTVSLAELGKVMVSMTLPEQYRNYESIDALLEDLSFVSVSYATGEPTVTVIEKSDLTYDAEAGTVSFAISDASAAYGYAAAKNVAPVYVAIILGAVAVVAIVAIIVVKKVKAPKKDA